MFNADNGTQGAGGEFGRTATLYLSNKSVGRIDVGREATMVLDSLTYFYMARYGSGNFIYNPANVLTHSNGIKYTSPALGPVTLQVHYDAGEVIGSVRTGRTISALGLYRAGPAFGLVGYQTSNGPTDIALGDKVATTNAGFSYDFGMLKPEVYVQNTRSGNEPRLVSQTMVNLALDVHALAGSFRFEYEMVKNKALARADAHSISVRYDYPLSKSTTVYTGVEKINDEANVYYPIVGASGSSPVAFPISPSLNGKDPSSFILGASHWF